MIGHEHFHMRRHVEATTEKKSVTQNKKQLNYTHVFDDMNIMDLLRIKICLHLLNAKFLG